MPKRADDGQHGNLQFSVRTLLTAVGLACAVCAYAATLDAREQQALFAAAAFTCLDGISVTFMARWASRKHSVSITTSLLVLSGGGLLAASYALAGTCLLLSPELRVTPRGEVIFIALPVALLCSAVLAARVHHVALARRRTRLYSFLSRVVRAGTVALILFQTLAVSDACKGLSQDGWAIESVAGLYPTNRLAPWFVISAGGVGMMLLSSCRDARVRRIVGRGRWFLIVCLLGVLQVQLTICSILRAGILVDVDRAAMVIRAGAGAAFPGGCAVAIVSWGSLWMNFAFRHWQRRRADLRQRVKADATHL